MKQKIENLAVSVLNKMGIKKAPIPIEELISAEGLNIKPYDFGDDVSGILYLENGVGTIGYMNQFMPKWRAYRDELNSLPVVHNDWGY